jgi:SNF2 family DNA or RNA helicase
MIKDLKIEFQHKMFPLKHQDRYWQESRDFKIYALWWEMGTMKSKVILDTATWLFIRGEIDGLLIISDKGCYMNWPDREIPKQVHESVPTRIAYWSSYMWADEKRDLDKVMLAKDDVLDILCMNVESFSSKNAVSVASQFIRSHYTLMVVDESTSIKNMGAQRTKNIIELGKQCDYRRVLTGTPITNSPLDVYAQCEFLQRGLLNHWSYVSFRAEFAVMERQYMGPNRPSFDKVVGYKNLDRLYERLSKFSSRVLKQDCLDLPDKVYEVIYVEQTPEQEEMYRKFKDEAVVQLDQGLLTSTSALTTINKLHQINCGHVKLDDKQVIDVPSNRVNVLVDLLTNKLAEEKVIVWCRFQRDIDLIRLSLERDDVDGYPVHYYGGTVELERREHLHLFMTDPKCKWLIGTPSTGGKGIDGLQDVCRYVVYYSSDYNLEDRLQSEDRLHRGGQKKQVTIIDLLVRDKVDEHILERLEKKEDLATEVLSKFRELV